MFIKICGITSPADALMVSRAGVTAIGLNFYHESPRSVSISEAQQVLLQLPVYVDAIGLFVNPTPSEIRRTALELGLKTIQLHGDITPTTVSDLTEFSVIVAQTLKEESDLDRIRQFWEQCNETKRPPTAILLDAYEGGKYGGTGKTAPWQLAAKLVQSLPVRVILAGGLRPKNVAAAIQEVRPWGVDVASGVEVSPGRKESYKVGQFMKAVQAAEASLAG